MMFILAVDLGKPAIDSVVRRENRKMMIPWEAAD